MTILLQKPWIKNSSNLMQAGQPSGLCPDAKNIPQLEQWLVSQRVHFGIVQETDDYIFACVDRTRSFPLFYAVSGAEFFLSDQPASIQDKQEPDQSALAIYLSSGFCAGDQTFLKNIHQLISGQYLIWDKKNARLTISAYYHYVPEFPTIDPGRDYKRELGQVLDQTIKRVIEQANGREIWVPLSGGLDSRAVLCKLHEHGYPRIQTFSYGSYGNTDSETARDIAKTLNVPWRYIEPSYKEQKKFFDSNAGTDFMRQATRFSSGPSFTDFFALQTLHKEGLIGPDILMVNGQSGDYITGGHLPLFKDDGKADEKLHAFFMNKHFSLWKSLTDKKEALCAPFVRSQRDEFAKLSSETNDYLYAYSFFNWLEWRERQSKYVVACQFNYNYFDCDWSLPLWDSDLMDFYETLPFDIFADQKLYIDYLQSWNYKNLFSFIRRPVDPWPRNRTLILTLGRMAGLCGGKKTKENFYRFLRYWSTQDVHFQLMPLSAWIKTWRNVQNAEGFYALEGLSRSGLQIDWDTEYADCRELLENHKDAMR